MSITLLNRESKSRAIDWTKLTLSLYVMPYVSPGIRTTLQQHVAAMEIDSKPFDVDCRVETDTSGGGTIKITTTIRPIEGAPAGAKLA